MNYRFNLLSVCLVCLFSVSARYLVPHSVSAQGLISALTVGADRADYSGPCPVEIRLTGRLKAEAALGVVRYEFVHSNGTPSAVLQLTVNSAGVFTVEETLRQTASWNDTVFLRLFLQIPGVVGRVPMLSNPITIKGQCRDLQAAPREASITLGPATGVFRVTLNGFTCNHQAPDDLLQADGADDEVFLFTKSFLVERRANGSGVTSSGPMRRRTQTIGDTSSGRFPGRVQGGSSRILGANGGFRAGDSFPGDPREHSSNPGTDALPLLIWEGQLTRRESALVVIPMIWEWDGLYGLFQAWENAGLDQLSTVGELIADPNRTDQEPAKVAIRGEVVGQVWMNGRGPLEPSDRPIGMRQYAGDYRFRPEVLILTYDEALRLASQSQRNNGRPFQIVYADAAELGGNYTLYIQVEKLR